MRRGFLLLGGHREGRRPGPPSSDAPPAPEEPQPPPDTDVQREQREAVDERLRGVVDILGTSGDWTALEVEVSPTPGQPIWRVAFGDPFDVTVGYGNTLSDLNLLCFLGWWRSSGLDVEVGERLRQHLYQCEHRRIDPIVNGVRLVAQTVDSSPMLVKRRCANWLDCQRCRVARSGYTFRFIGPWTPFDAVGGPLDVRMPEVRRAAVSANAWPAGVRHLPW